MSYATLFMSGIKRISQFVPIIPIIFTLSCTPIIRHHGYIHNDTSLDQIIIGNTHKETVINIMGSPSAVATVTGDAFYYISNTIHTLTYHHPKEIDRQITIIYFDDKETVRDIKQQSLKDGNIVAFVERITPFFGKKPGFLEQTLGNVGHFNYHR